MILLCVTIMLCVIIMLGVICMLCVINMLCVIIMLCVLIMFCVIPDYDCVIRFAEVGASVCWVWLSIGSSPPAKT